MKYIDDSPKIEKFLDQFTDQPLAENEMVVVRIMEDESGTLFPFLHIYPSANIKDIKDIAPLARRWQKRIVAFQGRKSDPATYLLAKISADQEESASLIELLSPSQRSNYASYRSIADAINKKTAAWLYEYLRKDLPEIENVTPELSRLDTIFGGSKSPPQASPYSELLEFHLHGVEECIEVQIMDPYERALKLLLLFQMKENDIKDYLDFGIEEINAGRYPFFQDQPLSKKKLIETLRWYRQKK